MTLEAKLYSGVDVRAVLSVRLTVALYATVKLNHADAYDLKDSGP